VKRGFLVAIGGAAIVATALTGCGGGNKASSGGNTASAGKGTAKVTVDSRDLSIAGDIGCVTAGDRVVMSVGDQTKGVVGATVTGSDVETVGVVTEGKPLGYTKGMPGGEATVKKDGNKYALSGNLTGTDMPDATGQMPKHPFTMEISCP
jgi:lipoprotein LpqH